MKMVGNSDAVCVLSFLGTQPCALIYELSAWLPLSRGRLEPLQQTLWFAA